MINRKIIKLSICILVISAVFIPVAGTMNVDKTINQEEGILEDIGQISYARQEGGLEDDYDWQIISHNVITGHGGSYPSGNVGIGTKSPSELLDVAGTAKVIGFKMPTDASDGYVLTSDGSGIGTWQEPTYVGIVSNGSTNYITKFIDQITIENSIIYEKDSKIGIGTNSPSYLFHVMGSCDIVAQFTGRVKGVQAVNDDEFVTKAQVKSIITKNYTPTGTSDLNGDVGDTAWDNNYFYVKTPYGWKRAALETWETPDTFSK